MIRPIVLAGLLALGSAALAADLPANLKTGEFVIGCQAWTFNKFSVFEAIDKTAQAGGKTIEFSRDRSCRRSSRM